MDENTLNNEQSKLVEEHVEFAIRLARKFYNSRPDSEFDMEDFEGAALLGLCDAARRFDECKGMNFRTFAYLRVRGAMLDAIRKGSGIPRRQFNRLVHNSLRENEACELKGETVKQENLPYGFARSSSELASIIDTVDTIPIRLSHNAKGELEPTYADAMDPERSADLKLTLERVQERLAELPDKHRKVVELRYMQEKSFDEIGNELGGLSKSWVCRIHAAAMKTIRDSFEYELLPQVA